MKKLLAICLSVLLVCAAIPFAFATADEAATLVLSSVEGKAGDEVSVTVSLKNNPGLVSAKVKVGYDANVLELVDKAAGEFPGSGFSWGALTKNPFVINFCDAIASEDYTYELLATLTFKIKDDAAAGEYPLTVECDYEGDFYNLAWDVIEFEEQVGSVTVKGDEPVTPPSGPVVPETPEFTDPTIVIPNVGAQVGDEVSVTVSLKNNPGLVSAKVKVGYDASALELIAKEAGEFPGSGYSWGALTKNPFVINFCDAIAEADYNYELLATLTFKVLDGAAGEYPFTLECDYEGDFYNLAWDVIEFAEYAGVIVVGGGEEPPVPPCEHEYDADCDPECNLCGELRPVHTEGIIHFDAVEPACHYNGNIEYWFCPKCECFWADEALTQLTNSKNVILPAIGGDVEHVEAKEPTATENGNIEYWFCPVCEQFWQNEALTQLTNSKNVIIPATGEVTCEHEYDAACDPECNLCGEIRPVHTEGVIHFDAVEAGCHYNGNIEYWFCPECECFWQDAALTQLTNSKNIIVPALGGEVIHFAAIAPGCHYNGQIEHWYCPECNQHWQDEALTELTNDKNVILPALGSENLQHIEAVEPTCSAAGNVEYWFCPDCEKCWTDEALTLLTNIKNVIVAPIDHTIVHMGAVEPGCHYIGNIEYWFCSACEMFWQDAALTQITNSKNVILPAIGGEVIAFEAIEPACHYNGQIAYWFCPECEQFWQDEALTQLTNSKNVVLPAIGSENLQHVEAVAPTATENGNIEYWFCPDCEQYWQDAALTQLTNSKNVILPALGENPCEHNIVHMEAVEPGCHYIGNIEYWFCTTCEIFWQDEALTQITNSKNVIVPAIGGDVIHFEAIEPSCHYNGQIEYWFCPDCEQFWQDEALTQLTNSKNVVLPATGGELVHIEAVEPGCHMIGNIEYWYCGACEQFWQDEALTQLTNAKNVILPATGGEVVHFEAIAPACHYNGQIEYWFCPECEQFWADEALTQLTNSKNVVLPAIGGEVIHVPAVEPTEDKNGNIEYWYCEQCDQYWTDEALTQLTNAKNVILAATGTDSPVTGDNVIVVVVALLTLVATGAAIVLVKNKKHA